MDRMWRTEKFKELPTEQQEEIAERVERGMKAAEERRLKLKERRQYLKEGRQHVVDSGNVAFLGMDLGDYPIMIGLQLDSRTSHARVAYAICSPNDHFSARVGRGIIGQRLKKRYIELEVGSTPLAISDAEVKVAVLQDIVKNPKTPQRLIKKILV